MVRYSFLTIGFDFELLGQLLPSPSQGWGTRAFLSEEQGNRALKMRGTEEQRQFAGAGNIENQDFELRKQEIKPIYFRGTREEIPPGMSSFPISTRNKILHFGPTK